MWGSGGKESGKRMVDENLAAVVPFSLPSTIVDLKKSQFFLCLALRFARSTNVPTLRYLKLYVLT